MVGKQNDLCQAWSIQVAQRLEETCCLSLSLLVSVQDLGQPGTAAAGPLPHRRLIIPLRTVAALVLLKKVVKTSRL